jgi:hypothetical protein
MKKELRGHKVNYKNGCYETVVDHFQGYFTSESFDGSYDTPQSHRARHDFYQLTNNIISWAQVHGNFKDAVKRAKFQPYEHWPELYDCCRRIVREHSALETQWEGGYTCAKIMRDSMNLLRELYGLNVPRWWLPIMDDLRGAKKKKPVPEKSFGEVKLENGRA